MPSDDDNRPTAFPLHNNERRLIDNFAFPWEQRINLSRRSGIQTRQNVFEPLAKADTVRFACRSERIQNSETLPSGFTAGKEAILSDDRNSPIEPFSRIF